MSVTHTTYFSTYSYGTDNKIGLRLSVCLCVCLSVRVSSLSRSHFFVDFHQI